MSALGNFKKDTPFSVTVVPVCVSSVRVFVLDCPTDLFTFAYTDTAVLPDVGKLLIVIELLPTEPKDASESVNPDESIVTNQSSVFTKVSPLVVKLRVN